MPVKTPVNRQTRHARKRRGWPVDRTNYEPARNKVDADELAEWIMSGRTIDEIESALGAHRDSIYRARVRIQRNSDIATSHVRVGFQPDMASRNDGRA